MRKITLTTLRDMKQAQEKIAVLTAYDASFAHVLEAAGVEVLLVGDSLGNVIQGNDSTLPVTVDDMIYHSRAVARSVQNSLIVTDMPFMSYSNTTLALENAGRIMKEGGAHVIKLEGGKPFIETVCALSQHGIPVCAHLGLQPQSVHKLGGYRVQGRDDKTAQDIMDDALALQVAGADMLVLECVPTELAQKVSEELSIPVIGIGAGPHCDGQVLVVYDMLGIVKNKPPRFVKDFLPGQSSIQSAIESYVKAVKDGSFPDSAHSFA